jgi:hypothetical protein
MQKWYNEHPDSTKNINLFRQKQVLKNILGLFLILFSEKMIRGHVKPKKTRHSLTSQIFSHRNEKTANLEQFWLNLTLPLYLVHHCSTFNMKLTKEEKGKKHSNYSVQTKHTQSSKRLWSPLHCVTVTAILCLAPTPYTYASSNCQNKQLLLA